LRQFLRAVWLVAAVFAGVARAHDADLVYVLVRVPDGAPPDELLETVTLTPGALGLLAPVDADGDGVLTQADLDARGPSVKAGVWDDMPLSTGAACNRSAERAWLREGYVELEARFRCGAGELRQDFRFLRVLPTNYRVVLGSQLDGERNRAFAQGTLTSLVVPRPAPPGWWSREAFAEGFSTGLARALTLLASSAVLALAFALAAWRQALVAAAALLAGLLCGSWVAVDVRVAAGLLAAAVIALAIRREVPGGVGVVVGVGVGLLEGGGPLARVVGLTTGSATVGAVALVAGVAVGRMLRRRGRALDVARWLVAALAAFSCGLVARSML
jgi:hypothetical protein